MLLTQSSRQFRVCRYTLTVASQVHETCHVVHRRSSKSTYTDIITTHRSQEFINIVIFSLNIFGSLKLYHISHRIMFISISIFVFSSFFFLFVHILNIRNVFVKQSKTRNCTVMPQVKIFPSHISNMQPSIRSFCHS